MARLRSLTALLALVSLCYLPVLVASYGFSDDYPVLAQTLRGNPRPGDMKAGEGRPLLALLTTLVFSALGGVSDLRYARLIGVLGTALLAWALERALLRAGWGGLVSFLLAFGLVTTPPFQVYAAWAVTSLYPLAALLAGVACRLADAGPSGAARLGRGRLAAAATLLALAVTIYQPAAMFYWVFVAIALFGKERRFGLARLGSLGAAGAVALAAGLLAAGIGARFYQAEPAPSLALLEPDPARKMAWFVSGPLTDALNLHRLSPEPAAAALVAAFILVGLAFRFDGPPRERAQQWLAAFALLPLSHLPSLVAAETRTHYRTEAALTSLVGLYAFLALTGFLGRLPPRVGARLAGAALGGFALAGALLASSHVEAYFASPQARELAFMRNALHVPMLSRARFVHVVGREREQTLAPGVRYDEFGLPSSATGWAPRAMVWLLLQEIDPAKGEIRVRLTPPSERVEVPPDAILIDMQRLAAAR